MRYGFCVPHHRALATPELIVESARRAEALGYDAIWMSDHVILPDTPELHPRRIFYEPLAVASYLAATTARVRLGFGVLIVPYRNPIVTAKQFATIDQMSGGRVVLGVGAGWVEAEFDALGVPFAERGQLTDEYLRAIRELWTSDSPRFAGATVRFEQVNFWPKPAQGSRLPVLVGGNSPRAIRRAAELGDGWYPSNIPLERLQDGIRRFRARCARLGRPTDLPIVYRTDVRLFDQSRGDRQRRPFAGTPDELVADLRAYAAAGVEELNLDFALPPVESSADWLATLERFTREVRDRRG